MAVPTFALMALALAACSTSGGPGSGRTNDGPAPSGSAVEPSAAAATELAGTKWQLSSYLDEAAGAQVPAAAERAGTLDFVDATKLAGSTGCNRFTGSYSQSGDQVTIQLGGITQMACTPPLATQETAVLAALPKTASIATTAAGDLQLRDASGSVLLVYATGVTSLDGTSWQALGIHDGKSAVVTSLYTEKATAAFSDGTISGSTGCNTFSGPYTTTKPDGITIGDLAVTLAACLDDQAAAVEQQYLAALAAATTYTIDGDRLTLRDPNGATQVSFRLNAAK